MQDPENPTRIVPANIKGIVPSTLAGKTLAAANTGVTDPVTGRRIKEAEIIAGGTSLTRVTGKVVLNGGTESNPQILENKWIDGCVEINGPWVTVRNNLIRDRSPGDWTNDCHGRSSTGSTGGSMMVSTGNDESRVKLQGIIIENNELHGTDTQEQQFGRGVIGEQGIQRISGNDIHGGKITMRLNASPSMPTMVHDNYIHGISKAHRYEPQNGIDCRPPNRPDTPICPDDFHGELIWLAGVGNIAVYSNYLDMEVTEFMECTAAIFAGSQSWGPSHDLLIANNFVNGGSTCSEINAADNSPVTLTRHVWVNNVFVSDGGYGPWVGNAPCSLRDYKGREVAWQGWWPNIDGSYFANNTDENGRLYQCNTWGYY